MTKALVLLSGGIDSTTALMYALRDHDHVEARSVNYGQRHLKEASHARMICDTLQVHHNVVHIPGVSDCMLTNKDAEIPDVTYGEIHGVSPTYVPFRNGLMLSYVASIAAAEGFDVIYFGAHAEDAAGDAYPDCTFHFVGAMAAAIYIGTYHKVRLVAPLIEMYKDEIIRTGFEMEAPFGLTWSCYKGEEKHCGACPTCYARAAGFINAGVPDPTDYAVDPVPVLIDKQLVGENA